MSKKEVVIDGEVYVKEVEKGQGLPYVVVHLA